MSLKIFLGKNKTGKTFEIKKIINEDIYHNMFYISLKEQNYENSLKQSLNSFLNINKGMEKNHFFGKQEDFEIYEFLKFILEYLQQSKIIMNEKTLIIDEIERFSHPELIEKIANTVFDLSKFINIIVTTHSPIFLQKVFKRHISDIESFRVAVENKAPASKHFIEYRFFYKDNEEYKNYVLSPSKIKKIFDKFQNREINNLARILFSQNIFLLEGINDENIIYNFINFNDKYNNFFYSLIDCGSKSQIKKMYNTLSELGLSKIMRICLFYDHDEDGKLTDLNDQNYFEIVNIPNLEETIFIKKNKEEYFIKTKNEISSIDKQDLVLKSEWIIKKSTLKNVDKNLKNLFSKLEKVIIWMNEAKTI